MPTTTKTKSNNTKKPVCTNRYLLFSPTEVALLREHISTDNTKYTLNGFYLTTNDGGKAVAVDGRRMIVLDKDDQIPESIHDTILEIPKIKKSEGMILDTKDMVWLVYNRKVQTTVLQRQELFDTCVESTIKAQVKNGIFPNYKMFLPERQDDNLNIGINSSLLVTGYKYNMSIKGVLDPIVSTITPITSATERDDFKSATVVIMPMKLDTD
jgi:hypothetical protein